MDIVVCVKVVPKVEEVKFDPETKRLDRSKAKNELNEADKNALELALRLKDKLGGKVTALSMGPPFFEPFLRLCVAMGADDAVLISDPLLAGADTYATSYVLAEAIKKVGFELVLCGESTADSGTAQVPPQVAEWLGVPHVSYVSSIEGRDGRIVAKRTVRGGYELVELELPALASVELGSNAPRFPDFKRKRWADKEFKLRLWSSKDLALDLEKVGVKGSKTDVKELRMLTPIGRRRAFLEGSEDEVTERLADIIRRELAA